MHINQNRNSYKQLYEKKPNEKNWAVAKVERVRKKIKNNLSKVCPVINAFIHNHRHRSIQFSIPVVCLSEELRDEDLGCITSCQAFSRTGKRKENSAVMHARTSDSPELLRNKKYAQVNGMISESFKSLEFHQQMSCLGNVLHFYFENRVRNLMRDCGENIDFWSPKWIHITRPEWTPLINIPQKLLFTV